MSEAYNHIIELLMRSNGIDLSRYDAAFLEKSLQNRMSETCCASIEAYANLLEQNKPERKIFFDSLHISYSGFFRNPLTFAVLERIVLPTIILQKKNSKRKEVRIWATACAAGQEAYSLAMLLEEMRNSDRESFDYRIFATDRSEQQINEAKKGQYFTTSLNTLNMKRAREWFTCQGDIYTITPLLKEKIDFSVFDLFNEQLSCPPVSIFGDFDVIVCANLLFYYTAERRKMILEKTTNCLAADGFYITGEVERDFLLNTKYHEVFPQSAIFRLNNALGRQ